MGWESCDVRPFGPSFKVKQLFTGFGELSFRWIQMCIGFPMRRSGLYLALTVGVNVGIVFTVKKLPTAITI